MNRLSALAYLLAFAFAAGVVGCNATDPDNANVRPTEQSKVGDPKRAGDQHSSADMERAEAQLANLSPDDAASAKQQRICPVSGELLGTMGPPKKVDVNGQQVWICCDACREKLLENPQDYLAKLKKS